MPNWTRITKADLYNSKAAALIDAADRVSLGQGQTDRSPGITADVVTEIRRRVAKCNQLDQDPSAIPAGLKPLAVDLIYCRLKNALELALTDDERLFLKQREDQLDRIADGRDVVEPPDTPMAVNPAPTRPHPRFAPPHPREFTPQSQNG